MLKIAVCDDDEIMRREITSILFEYFQKKTIEFKIFSYSEGSELLNEQENFDIVFLDIEMKKSNGIETAHMIRERDINVPIVFVTSYVDYWQRAFKVHAFGFITKPFKNEELFSIMDDFFEAKYSTEDTIMFSADGSVVCLRMSDIYYFIFESKKKVYVITADERILIKENISDIYDKLDKSHFYLSKRNCIVNLKYVKKIQNEYVIVMKNGDLLPLAQKKKNEFMQMLSNEFVNKLKGRNI